MQPQPNHDLLILGSLAAGGVRKWHPLLLPGIIITRSEFDHPGVDLHRLAELGVVREATADESLKFRVLFGGTVAEVAARDRSADILEENVRKELLGKRLSSHRAAWLLELFDRWREGESQCSRPFASTFIPGEDFAESDSFASYVRRSIALAVLVRKSEVLRVIFKDVAEPLMARAEELSLESTPMHNLVAMMKHNFDGSASAFSLRDLFAAQDWCKRLTSKLQAEEAKVKPLRARVGAFAMTAAGMTLSEALKVLTGMIVGYLLGRYVPR